MKPEMPSKPCARPGCTQTIYMPGEKTLAKRIYCSRSCSAQVRLANGWNPQAHLTPDSYRKGGALGGKIAGENRRKRKVLDTVAHLSTLIPEAMKASLGHQELTRVKLLLQRAHDVGYRRGYRCAWAAKRSKRPAMTEYAA